MKEIYLRPWFDGKLAKELGLPEKYTLNVFAGVRQTEKAVYCILHTGYDDSHSWGRYRVHWIPKSAIDGINYLPMFETYEKAVEAYRDRYGRPKKKASSGYRRPYKPSPQLNPA